MYSIQKDQKMLKSEKQLSSPFLKTLFTKNNYYCNHLQDKLLMKNQLLKNLENI
jgi:hypothetical protein